MQMLSLPCQTLIHLTVTVGAGTTSCAAEKVAEVCTYLSHQICYLSAASNVIRVQNEHALVISNLHKSAFTYKS